MDYDVSLEGTTLVTLHAGSDTTARDDATDQLTASLEELEADDAIADWVVTDAEVYEHPAAPFDPYTVAVAFAVTVTVEADDLEAAKARGEVAIDEALESADFDAVTYTSAPYATAA